VYIDQPLYLEPRSCSVSRSGCRFEEGLLPRHKSGAAKKVV
jgi:hypothetical protein